jgi:regulator of RNase E activity RraA
MSDGTEIRDRFLKVSTATLTTVLFKRGLRNVFIEGARPLNPAACRMAGPAFTLRYIPSREDIDVIDVFKDPRHPQRHAVETIPPGAVMVIDSRGDARAASAGGILVRRMMVRGAAGIVTDGGLRDSPAVAALEIPTYYRAPHASVLGVLHYPLATNVPVACGGVLVMPGDVVVGDAEGVVVVPAQLAEEVGAAAVDQELREEFAFERVDAGESIRGVFPLSEERRAEYEAWREARRPAGGPQKP